MQFPKLFKQIIFNEYGLNVTRHRENSFQLPFIGKVILVFWRLSVEGFYRYLWQQYAARGIFSSLYTSYIICY